jgi:hypothetical protein
MPGDHLSRDYLLQVLRTAGIPVLATRNATWQQLTRQAPPQVLADALGISPATAMRHAGQAGSDWARYAATTSRALASCEQRKRSPGVLRTGDLERGAR